MSNVRTWYTQIPRIYSEQWKCPGVIRDKGDVNPSDKILYIRRNNKLLNIIKIK